MIEFNMIVPIKMKDDILAMAGSNFRIITSTSIKTDRIEFEGEYFHYFHVVADEKDMLFFMLKFGSNNVWRR